MSVNGANDDELSLAVKKSPQADLERQHRAVLEGYRPAPTFPVTEPQMSERDFALRTFTTYGAYEKPI